MALKDALKLINGKLRETFMAKPYDPAPARKKAVRLIRRAKEQVAGGRVKATNGSWQAANEVVAFSLLLNGHVVELEDPITEQRTSPVYVAAGDFAQFCDLMIAGVEAGDLDAELQKAMTAGAAGSDDTKVEPQEVRKPVPRAGRRSSISPEAAKLRGQKAAASRAANRAAREAGEG